MNSYANCSPPTGDCKEKSRRMCGSEDRRTGVKREGERKRDKKENNIFYLNIERVGRGEEKWMKQKISFEIGKPQKTIKQIKVYFYRELSENFYRGKTIFLSFGETLADYHLF